MIKNEFFSMSIHEYGFSSGHWKNLRSFDIERWEVSDDKFRNMPALNYFSLPLLNDFKTTDLFNRNLVCY